MEDEDTTREREQMEWPLDESALLEVLNGLDADTREVGRGDLSPLEAAVLEAMSSAGGSLTVGELAEKLAFDYDRPPTREAVLKVHCSRMSPHTNGAPSNNWRIRKRHRRG